MMETEIIGRRQVEMFNNRPKQTIEPLKPYIDEAFAFLKTCDDLESNEALKYLDKLKSFTYGHDIPVLYDINELGLYLIERGYAALFPKLWKKMQHSSKQFMCMVICFLNCTNECQSLGDELVKHGVVELLFQTLANEIDHGSYFNSLIMLLNNIIRHNNVHRKLYRSTGGVKILKRLYENVTLKTHTLLLLSYIVDEEDNKQLGDDGVLEYLVSLLESAIKEETHSTLKDGFYYSAVELLEGLNRLLLNDNNKQRVGERGTVKLLLQMLKEPFTVKEKQLAVEGLWSLSFLDDIQTLMVELNVAEELKALVKTDDTDLRKECLCGIWQIQNSYASPGSGIADRPPPYSDVISENVSAQIMISYQWDSKERARYICSRLKRAGYQVWIDEDNIRGDILEAMGNGVESSQVVIACITEKYKESRFCRSEAEYAHQLKKPMFFVLCEAGYKADSWLGIMLGATLYYDVTGSAEENNLNKLCNDIDIKLGILREDMHVSYLCCAYP